MSRPLQKWWQFYPSWPVLLAIFFGTGLLYYVAGRLALLVLSQPEGVAVFWPASGIAAGLALALTRPARAPIALAVAAATVIANLEARANIAATSVFAVCNAVECLIFVWVMQRLDKARTQLESLPSFAAFVVAAAVAAGVSALPPAVAIQALGLSSSSLLQIWITWFISDALGILVMAPAIITLPQLLRHPPNLAMLLEGGLGVTVTVMMAVIAVLLPSTGSAWPVIAPATLLFPCFLWLAGRMPAWFTTVGVLFASAVVAIAALTGVGRFSSATTTLPDRVLAAEVFVLTMAIAVLTLSAVFARNKNTALALQSSEERLRLALAAGRMYAFDFDQTSGVVRRTGGLLDRLQLPDFGTIKDYSASLDRADLAGFEAMLASLSPAEPRSLRVLHLHTPAGEVLTVELRTEAVFADDGRLLNIRGTCTDITESEVARQALEESAAKLRRALEAGRVFAFEANIDSDIVDRSENAADILGIASSEIGMPRSRFLKYLHPDDRAALEGYRDRLTPENSFASENFRFIRPDGKMVWLEMTATGTFDQHGQLVRRRGLVRDVTERVQAEELQAELNKELDHRVKNALATVNDVIELSRDDNDTIATFIAKIDGRIRAMSRAHDRLTSNKWAGVSVAALVEDEIEAYRKTSNCLVEGPPLVLSPKIAQSFAQTIHELATNAAKHGALVPYNGRVDVRWLITGDAIRGQRLALSWHEHCVRPVEPPKRESYGLKAIRNILPHGHDATVDVRFLPTGLHCEIDLALGPATALPAGGRNEIGSEADVSVAKASAAQR